MDWSHVKIRSRQFDGRCGKHKGYNPAVEGRAGIRGACARCQLLCEIWETSICLNQLIRKFNPNHDDAKRSKAGEAVAGDPRQMSLIESSND